MQNNKIPHQQMLVNWYINMYAFYNQQAFFRPEMKQHWLNKMDWCIDMYIAVSNPISITEILPT